MRDVGPLGQQRADPAHPGRLAGAVVRLHLVLDEFGALGEGRVALLVFREADCGRVAVEQTCELARGVVLQAPERGRHESLQLCPALPQLLRLDSVLWLRLVHHEVEVPGRDALGVLEFEGPAQEGLDSLVLLEVGQRLAVAVVLQLSPGVEVEVRRDFFDAALELSLWEFGGCEVEDEDGHCEHIARRTLPAREACFGVGGRPLLVVAGVVARHDGLQRLGDRRAAAVGQLERSLAVHLLPEYVGGFEVVVAHADFVQVLKRSGQVLHQLPQRVVSRVFLLDRLLERLLQAVEVSVHELHHDADVLFALDQAVGFHQPAHLPRHLHEP